jgi:hypothetical protein
MTKTARLILEDAKYAIDKYTEDLQGADFRISWLAIITLLSSVKDGLENVDRHLSPEMKSAIKTKRQENDKLKPDIFFKFINKERNWFVHQYKHGVRKSVYAEAIINNEDGSSSVAFRVYLSNPVNAKLSTTNGRYQSIIADGPFAGMSEKVVALLAYEWWLKYLDEVDRLAKIDSSKRSP